MLERGRFSKVLIEEPEAIPLVPRNRITCIGFGLPPDVKVFLSALDLGDGGKAGQAYLQLSVVLYVTEEPAEDEGGSGNEELVVMRVIDLEPLVPKGLFEAVAEDTVVSLPHLLFSPYPTCFSHRDYLLDILGVAASVVLTASLDRCLFKLVLGESGRMVKVEVRIKGVSFTGAIKASQLIDDDLIEVWPS